MITKLKEQKKIGVVDAIRMRVRRGNRIPQAFLDKYLQREDIDKRDKIAVAEVFKAGKRYVEAGDIYARIGYAKRAADLYFREAEQTLDYDEGCELYKRAARLYMKVDMYERTVYMEVKVNERTEECMTGIGRLAERAKNTAEFVADSESGLGTYVRDRLKEIDDRRMNDLREIMKDLATAAVETTMLQALKEITPGEESQS
ncbi:TPA: hypothetical protein HA238_00500 [Candidatus Micrarchaeota archaeon]|nr:hypothetical protein [Candidatus Micrarchaeota archaeon]